MPVRENTLPAQAQRRAAYGADLRICANRVGNEIEVREERAGGGLGGT